MKEVKFYRTYSWGGCDGREKEIRDWETIELAKADALKDTWNSGFALYEVTITFNGKVTTEENWIGNLRCGRDERVMKRYNELIESCKENIKTHTANTKIKESTRKMRIAQELKMIEEAEWTIENIKNKI